MRGRANTGRGRIGSPHEPPALDDMWKIKKWPARILQGALAGAQVVNATGLGGVFPPLGVAAAVIGAAQVGVAIVQHKSTEDGKEQVKK